MRTVPAILLPLGLLGFATGCHKQNYNLNSGAPGAYDTGAWDNGGSEGDDTGDGDTSPPEEEQSLLLLPAQTDVYVFIANPDRNTVTRVNVYTLDVRTAPVGVDPEKVLTTPDYSKAVVFNRGDDTVSILDADTLDTVTVPVRDNFNDMVMSPDGNWVALWHDQAAEKPDDPPADGLESFNEVSFVDVRTGEHFPMAIDYNPREIQFTPDSSTAVVVTNTSLGVVDLTAAVPSPHLVPVTDDLVDPPEAEEVAVTPSGEYAFVRQFGVEDLTIVDLKTDDVEQVPCGQNPTDLDITPDGLHAVVVSRGSREVRRFDTTDPYAPPDVFALPGDSPFGSVLLDPTGHQAILYTTAYATDRYVTWDLDSDEMTLRSLVKPVQSMAITPTGDSLLVFHTKTDAADADTSSPFYGQWALTLISLADFRSNPLKLPAEPIGYANSNNGHYGYFVMDGQPYLEVLDYATLLYDQMPLKSDPVFVGVLPDLDLTDGDEPPAWVSQQHDLGRISFYDPDDKSMETITGFELNAEIEED